MTGTTLLEVAGPHWCLGSTRRSLIKVYTASPLPGGSHTYTGRPAHRRVATAAYDIPGHPAADMSWAERSVSLVSPKGLSGRDANMLCEKD
jgi:hypothetical protein